MTYMEYCPRCNKVTICSVYMESPRIGDKMEIWKCTICGHEVKTIKAEPKKENK